MTTVAWPARLARRSADPHVLLATTIVVVAIAGALMRPGRPIAAVVAGGVALLTIQILIATRSVSWPRGLVDRHTLRLVATLLYTAAANMALDPASWPLAPLFVPIVTLSAAIGWTVALRVCAVAALMVATPFFVAGQTAHPLLAPDRELGLAATMVLLVLGTRRTVSSLEGILARLRALMHTDRDRAAGLAAVEEAGRVLAAEGPTPAALERVMSLMESRLGYTFVSIYLGTASRLRLGAQRGYAEPLLEFDGSGGVIGRTMRLRSAQLIPDVTHDPDYWTAEGGVRSEICVPLLSGNDLLGVINVESATELDSHDLATATLVADRVAAALALADERAKLAERAEAFRRIVAFASTVTGSLDLATVPDQIAVGVGGVIDADTVIVTALDQATGRYWIRAGVGMDPAYVGLEIEPGTGMAGRAIRSRAMVVDDSWDRSRYHPAARDAIPQDAVASIAVPLLRDDVVVGALTLIRDVDRPFTELEREVALIIGGQAALALANAALMARAAESALQDPLTGLPNRRFLDATLERLDAVRRRQAPAERRALSAILFDLDRFGDFNKLHGHQAGDEVLRGFAEVLRGRLRASDIVARYGGEEFLVVLDGTDRDDALRIAEEIRTLFAAREIRDPAGEPLRATVSGGCASIREDESISELVRLADAGLAMAKRGGRNQVVAV